MKTLTQIDRRDFIKSTAIITSGTLGLSMLPNISTGTPLIADERENVIGPREGFSPQIGTLLSMMTWMRRVILNPVKGMTPEQLDYLIDDTSNSIGAMLFQFGCDREILSNPHF